jgi:hypothetical protein
VCAGLGRCRGLGQVGGAAHFPFFKKKQISSYFKFSSNKIKTKRNQALNKSSKNNAAA